jgi:uncharacterized protein (TIGR00255 family)
MIRSMTGYGRCQEINGGWDISVEIKSVNHRYFEFSCRLPRSCAYLEDKLKGLVQSRISRGKIDLYLSLSSVEGDDMTIKFNLALAKNYLSGLNELSSQTGLENDVTLSALSRFPDIFTLERAKIDEDELLACVKSTALKALDSFVGMREEEGRRLKEDLLSRLDNIVRLISVIEEQSPRP